MIKFGIILILFYCMFVFLSAIFLEIIAAGSLWGILDVERKTILKYTLKKHLSIRGIGLIRLMISNIREPI
jgi:hypothetical protein